MAPPFDLRHSTNPTMAAATTSEPMISGTFDEPPSSLPLVPPPELSLELEVAPPAPLMFNPPR